MQTQRFAGFRYFTFKYKLHCLSILILILISSIADGIGIAAFLPLFSSLTEQTHGTPSNGILSLSNYIISWVPTSDTILSASIIIIILFCFRIIISLAREVLTAITGAKITYDVKTSMMNIYSQAEYQYFIDNRQSSLIYRGLYAPHSVGTLIIIFSQILAHLIKTVAITIVLILISPIAVLFVAIVCTLYYFATHQLSSRVSFNIGKRKAETSGDQIAIMNDYISGVRQIIATGSVTWWIKRFEKATRLHSTLLAKELSIQAVPRPVMEILAVLTIIGFLVISKLTNSDNFASTLPTLGVLAVAMMQLLPSLAAIGRARMQIMSVLHETNLTYESIVGPISKRSLSGENIASFNQAITLENVSFTHKGREQLISGLNLNIEKGKVTALVGESGSGKTTILNLILGLLQPTQGMIKVDNIPLESLSQQSWLNKIGFVSQDSFMFHASIAENILLGRDVTSDSLIISASETANAHQFISQLPEGYDTIIGDKGMRLSGGQQQRIAIARAMINQPEILILDEATSSLDSISEREVQEALDNISDETTIIIVAHRLTTISRADKIIVINNGKVVEEGTHYELLDQQGEYSQLVRTHPSISE